MTETPQRLTGIVTATPNTGTRDIRFAIEMADGSSAEFVAGFGAMEQLLSNLGMALHALTIALREQQGWEGVPVIPLREIQAQKNPLTDHILMNVITVLGVPFRFEFPPAIALALADRLRSEALKESEIGHA
ncbi:MAG: hypothetical protein ACLPPF_13740 [Rhodomicrobium sp.]